MVSFIEKKKIKTASYYSIIIKLENVEITCEMPKTVLNVSLTPSCGKYNFDSVKKLLTWEVGRIDASKTPNLRGNVFIVYFLFNN